ncbi:hypothetical protein D3C83_21730 [compost metagenome]
MRHQDAGDVDRLGDRRKIAQRVVAAVRQQAHRNREAADRAHHQRVAVGGRFHDDLGAERAARSGAVLHHHRLLQALGHLLRHEPRDDVRRSAGRERHDHSYRLGRVGLRFRFPDVKHGHGGRGGHREKQ